ncbi:hypothetical protein [Ligilactobacillus saerimneri]|uniref:hypothetical protein n=1 Tax=Ligilactobacillus saerimneri TaxID=228229 RepID=UPI00042174D0|nr:hypothetical protein [Ligilactobacillus saerimneri]
MKIKYRYEDEKLMAEVLSDLEEFGPDKKVIAIYSVFPQAPDVDFITDYLWDEPTRDEVLPEDFDRVMKEYQESLKTLEKRKWRRMTMMELADILQEQARVLKEE